LAILVSKNLIAHVLLRYDHNIPKIFLEIVGDIELLVQRKHSFEQSLLHSGEVEPSMQKEPSLDKHYLPVITASPKEQPSSHFIDRIVISSNTFSDLTSAAETNILLPRSLLHCRL
jgi:hypothetical protein